ncbi:MAG: hypothetical protein WC350_00875 [Candidatus Micrarchaeia archaeon]|jgi:hypothetical protein
MEYGLVEPHQFVSYVVEGTLSKADATRLLGEQERRHIELLNKYGEGRRAERTVADYARARAEIADATVKEGCGILELLPTLVRDGMRSRENALEALVRVEERYFDEHKRRWPGWKPDEETAARARDRFRRSREGIVAAAAERMSCRSYEDGMVEGVRTGRLNLDEAIVTLETHMRCDLGAVSGGAMPSAAELQASQARYGPVTERLKAAAAEFASASRFVQGDRNARVRSAAPKDGRMARVVKQ